MLELNPNECLVIGEIEKHGSLSPRKIEELLSEKITAKAARIAIQSLLAKDKILFNRYLELENI